MPLCFLPSDARSEAFSLLGHCPTGVLEQALSSEDVYLGFQNDLLNLDRKQRHTRLAELVLLLLGNELLRNNLVRESLCELKDIAFTSAWKSGTEKAIGLCRDLDLPLIFAGSLPPNNPPPISVLGSATELPDLQDFQVEVFKKSQSLLQDHRSVLLSLPTGGGKTRVGVEIIHAWHQQAKTPITTIWIAHTDELCDQAAECLGEVWRSRPSNRSTTLLRGWGRNLKRLLKGELFLPQNENEDESNHAIIITTPKSSETIFSAKIQGSLGQCVARTTLVVVDEAHRSAAPSYSNLLKIAKTRFEPLSVLGLSATPVRATYSSRRFEGTIQLSKIFEELVEPLDTLGDFDSPVKALQSRGVLAELEIVRLKSDLGDLKRLADEVSRQYSKAKEGPAILFSSTVSDAKVLASYAAENGIRSSYVTSNSTDSERQLLVRGLRDQKIQLLCNCEILTTGFNAPAVTDLFLARKTESPVLYKQIVGRGLRGPAFGGAPKCRLYLCGFDLPFPPDPNTSEFARTVWRRS